MNPLEMVVAIVGICAVASVVRARYGDHRRRGARRDDMAELYGRDDGGLAAENTALRDELRGMKDRIQVLERLATDDESDARRLDREIEKLRDTRATGKDLTGE